MGAFRSVLISPAREGLELGNHRPEAVTGTKCRWLIGKQVAALTKLRVGGQQSSAGCGAGEGFVGALLESEFGTSEDSKGFVHWDDVGAAGGRSAGLRPASGSVAGYGLPVVQLERGTEET